MLKQIRVNNNNKNNVETEYVLIIRIMLKPNNNVERETC